MAGRKKKTQSTEKPEGKPLPKKKAAKRGRPKKKGKKNLNGATQWNNVRLRVKQFYATRGIDVTEAEIREYSSKLYEFLKANSRAYKNGNVRILKKTLDDTFRGDVRTHDIFVKMGLPYPGSKYGNDEFYYWDLSSELLQYDQDHDRITLDLRIMGGFGPVSPIEKYTKAFDALMAADNPVVSTINAWIKFIDDQSEGQYFVFVRTSKGANDWHFELTMDSGENVGGAEMTGLPAKPSAPETKPSDAETAEKVREAKGRADEAENKAGKAKVDKLSAIIDSNNSQIKSFKDQRKSSQSIINEVLDTLTKKKKAKMKVDRELAQISRLEKEVDELEFLEEVMRKENEEIKKQISKLK